MKVLVIEDDLKLLNMLRKGLHQAAYEVDVAVDGLEGYDKVRDSHYDLILLDLMLPKLSGWELIPVIRKFSPTTALIALTARVGLKDRVQGLKLGCDDYIIKPFSFEELLARMEAAIRARSSSFVTELHAADLVLDLLKKTVTRNGVAIDLSNKEFLILEYLVRNENKAVTRQMILENIWNNSADMDTNVVDVYINFLRNKVDRDFSPPLIHTIRGLGYVLRSENK